MSIIMKQKADEKLKNQSLAIVIGLSVALILLCLAFVLSAFFMSSLENKLTPLFDAIEKAVLSSDMSLATDVSSDVLGILEQAEGKLQLFANHYDIEQCMNAARLLAILNDDDTAERLDVLVQLRSYIHFIRENNSLSIGLII